LRHGDEEVSWLGVVDRGTFPMAEAISGILSRSRRLQLRGQRRHRTGLPWSRRSRADA